MASDPFFDIFGDFFADTEAPKTTRIRELVSPLDLVYPWGIVNDINYYSNRPKSDTTRSLAEVVDETIRGEGGGQSDRGTKGTNESGPLTADEKSQISAGFRGASLANNVAGLFGSAMPGFGTFSAMARGMLGLSSAIADFFGVQRDVNPMLGLTPTDIQGIRDTFGAFAAEEAETAAAAARQNTFDQMQAGHSQTGGEPGGFVDGRAPSPSVGPEAGWGPAGPDSGNSPGSAGMDSGSASGGPGTGGASGPGGGGPDR